MAEFPNFEEMAKNVAEQALDNFLYDGKSIREWMQIIVSEDCISRQAAIKAAMQDVDDRRTHGFNAGATRAANRIKLLPPITPLQEHGRLCDLDELVKNIVKEYGVNSIHELPQDIKMFYDKFINSAPTILDATFDYKLNNYSFFRKEERG